MPSSVAICPIFRPSRSAPTTLSRCASPPKANADSNEPRVPRGLLRYGSTAKQELVFRGTRVRLFPTNSDPKQLRPSPAASAASQPAVRYFDCPLTPPLQSPHL